MKVVFFLFAFVFFAIALSGLIEGIANGYVLTQIISIVCLIFFPVAVYLDWKRLGPAYGFKTKKDSSD